MKRYKTTRRSLRPWHFSLPDRLRMVADRGKCYDERKTWGGHGRFLKIFWHHSFRRRPLRSQ